MANGRTLRVKRIEAGLDTADSRRFTVFAYDQDGKKVRFSLAPSEVLSEERFRKAVQDILGEMEVHLPEETPGWAFPWSESDEDAYKFGDTHMAKMSEQERAFLLSRTERGRAILNSAPGSDPERDALLALTPLGRAVLADRAGGVDQEPVEMANFASVGAGSGLFKPGEREALLGATDLGRQVLADEAAGRSSSTRGTASTGSGYSTADAGVPPDGTGGYKNTPLGSHSYGSGHEKQRGTDAAVPSSRAVGKGRIRRYGGAG
jgi:hypothetical protein